MIDREDVQVLAAFAFAVIIVFVGLVIVAAAAGLAFSVFRVTGGF